MDSLTNFNEYISSNNINLHICRNTKFKTNLIQLYILQPLNKKTASKTALLPYILYRGSQRYPTSRDLVIRLEELFGAYLSVSVSKRGENQLIVFSLELVNGRFLPNKVDLLEQGLELINEILTNPLLVNNSFKEEYVKQEKAFLKQEIESLINNKDSYAQERCYQKMCAEEPYGIYKLGNVSCLQEINKENLYSFYQKLIKNNPILLFVVGDIEEKKVYEKINKIFTFEHKKTLIHNQTLLKSQVDKVKEITESLNIKQGKLLMGFRTGINRKDELYYALLLYNGILGKFPHSKLFQNVREKYSLAYYAYSQIESTKGLLTIASGIDFNNYQQAKEIILKELTAMTKGNFSTKEFEFTKKGLVNQLQSVADSNFNLTGQQVLAIINQKRESINSLIEKIKKVSRKEVIEVAQKIKLDTIYFLKDKEL